MVGYLVGVGTVAAFRQPSSFRYWRLQCRPVGAGVVPGRKVLRDQQPQLRVLARRSQLQCTGGKSPACGRSQRRVVGAGNERSESAAADLRAACAAAIDGATNLWMELDGSRIPHLQNNFRVQSPAFNFTIPDDNLFNAIGEGPYAAGSYFPAVDDGVYVMLSPLTAGPHKIRFHGYMPMYNFTLDITYNLMVTK